MKIVAILCKAGATLDLVDSMKRTALHQAVVYGHLQIVKILCKAGANPTLRDEIIYQSIILHEKFPMEVGNLYLSIHHEAKRLKVQSLYLNAPKYFGKSEYEALQQLFKEHQLNSSKLVSEIKNAEVIQKITSLCHCESKTGNQPIDLARQYLAQNNSQVETAKAIETLLFKYTNKYLESNPAADDDQKWEVKNPSPSRPHQNLQAPIGRSTLFQPVTESPLQLFANRLYQAIHHINEKQVQQIFFEIKDNDPLRTQLLNGDYLPQDQKQSPIKYALQMVKVCSPQLRTIAMSIVKCLLKNYSEITSELRATLQKEIEIIRKIDRSLIDNGVEQLIAENNPISLFNK